MGLKKAVNLLIDVTEDGAYLELDRELRQRIENELDKNEQRIKTMERT